MQFSTSSEVIKTEYSKYDFEKARYYDEWPDANYDDVVKWRFDRGINRYNKLRSFVMTTYARIDLTKTNYSVMKNCKILENPSIRRTQ